MVRNQAPRSASVPANRAGSKASKSNKKETQKGHAGLAAMDLSLSRSAAKPGGISGTPGEALPVDNVVSNYTRLISSDDLGILMAVGKGFIDVLYHPGLDTILKDSRHLNNTTDSERKDIVTTMRLRLGVLVYRNVANALTMNGLVSALSKKNKTPEGLVETVSTIEDAAVAVNSFLCNLLGLEETYDRFGLMVLEDENKYAEEINRDRIVVNFGNLMLRAVKPDSATRAPENNEARSRAKQGQMQVAVTLPMITQATAMALHAGFTHTLDHAGSALLMAFQAVEQNGSGPFKLMCMDCLNLLHDSGSYGLRFVMQFVVKQCPEVMTHRAMGESLQALTEFLAGMKRVSELDAAEGGTGFYSRFSEWTSTQDLCRLRGSDARPGCCMRFVVAFSQRTLFPTRKQLGPALRRQKKP